MQRALVQAFKMALLLLAAMSLMVVGAHSSDKVIVEGRASDGESLRLEIVRPIPEAACTAFLLYKGDEQVLAVTEYSARSPEELVGAAYFPVLGIYVVVAADLENNVGSEVEVLAGREGGQCEILPRGMVRYDVPFIEQPLNAQLNEWILARELGSEIGTFLDSLGLGTRWDVRGFSFSAFRRLCEYDFNPCESRHFVFSYADLLPEATPTLVYNSAASEFGSLVISTAVGWWGWIAGFFAGAGDILAHHPEWLPSGGGTKLAIPPGARQDPHSYWNWDYPDRVVPKYEPWNVKMK